VLFWYNFPCNDYIPALLNIDGIRWLDPKLPEAILGIVSNGMTQPEAEKLPLSTIADYLNDPEHYDRDISYKKALRELFPENHEALKFILSTLYSGIVNKHEDSVPFARALATKDFKTLYSLFVRLRDDAEKILNDEPNRAFVEQINSWLEKARLYGLAGIRLMESLDAATLGDFWTGYKEFTVLCEKAMGISKFVSKNTLTPFFIYTSPLLAKEKIEMLTGKEMYNASASTVTVYEKAEAFASAGSYRDEYPASAMTDSRYDTFYWSDCAADNGFYVQLDLGGITEIHNIVMFSGVGNTSEDYIREGQMLLSDDGEKWNQIGTVQHTRRVIFDGLCVKARYVRYMSVSTQGFWFSCGKFAVNETLVNPHISCTAIAEYSHSAPNMVDGCFNTFFRVKNAPDDSKIIIDIPDYAENMAVLGESCEIKNVAGRKHYEIAFSGDIAINELLFW
jgi:hyaluronoglucosaminidase